MKIDWTLNVETLIALATAVGAFLGLLLRLQDVAHKFDTRITLIESWIKEDGGRSERALNVLETVGKSLERVTALYESTEKRVDRMQEDVNAHHRDFNIHHLPRD